MLTYFWIMFGGALGSGARFWVSGLLGDRWGVGFPWGTLFVNLSGSFIIGAVAALTEPGGPWLAGPRLRQFMMIGIFGGYTTFSSFSLQTMELVREGDWLRASANSIFSLVGCLAAVWLGRTFVLAFLAR